MSKELLIELFSEEIPARMQADAAKNFKTLCSEKMTGREIPFGSVNTYVTPRRLVLHAQDLPEKQEDWEEERRGPRIDAPSPAIEGFLASAGVTLRECEQRKTPKGSFYFLTLKKQGQKIRDILPQVIREIIYEFPWTKSMRWAASRHSWVRPLHSGVCVFDEQTIPFEVLMGAEEDPDAPRVYFNDISYGHRFLNPEPFKVKNFTQYSRELRARHVILDQEERKAEILTEVQKLAEKMGYQLRHDPGLLEEVTGLVEWPVFFTGSIDPSFMSLPPKVLVTSMRIHQRYFALETPEGALASSFIIVANTRTRDKGKKIVLGNERVLKARLADAQFFYEQDKKISLQEHGKKLQNVIFHDLLGTMAEKVDRLKIAAEFLAPKFGISPGNCRKWIEILKADLVTEMVGEFPELQGTMGTYYAIAQGAEPQDAQAIEEHYSPRGSQDQLPASELGRFFALIDRFDTLIGFFAMGIKPTGSKDPYALRRTALGIIRLLEDEEKDFNFDDFLSWIYNCLREKPGIIPFESLDVQLREFFVERLKIYWRDQGISHDVMAAAFSVGRDDTLYVLKRRCQALQKFLKSKNETSNALLSAYRRACNIIRIEEGKDHFDYHGEVDKSLLEEKAEVQLFEALQKLAPSFQKAFKSHNFASVMNELAMLKPVIDTYFNDVKVNADNPKIRANRLRTLSFFRLTIEKIADFSKIEDTL